MMTIPKAWSDDLRKILLTALVGSVGTVLFYSGSFILDSHDNSDWALAPFKDFGEVSVAKLARENDFLAAAERAEIRAESRFSRALTYLQSHASTQNGNGYLTLISGFPEEAEEDKASLDGFTPRTTGLPDYYHRALSQQFEKEVSVWEAEVGYFSSAKGKEGSVARKLQRRRAMEEMHNEVKFMESLMADMRANEGQQQAALDEASKAALSRLSRIRRDLIAANLGLTISLVGFYFLWKLAYQKKPISDAALPPADSVC